MNPKPAILGAPPTFASKIPITRPALPDISVIEPELEAILTNGVLTKGPHVRALEAVVAEHLNVRHAVAVSSCTTGLMLAYKALDLTGEIVVPSFTFMATVSAQVWAGLIPVFADIDYETSNLDPKAAEAAITVNTSAIVAVHNSGNPADISELEAVARRHSLPLIFDAAHALGSLYHGMPVGPQGIVQVFSLSPTKLVVAGEGGIVATNDSLIAKKIRIGREYGNQGNYDSAFPGFNARLPEINALLGELSLREVESAARHRNEIAASYRERLAKLPGVGFQTVQIGNRCSYKDFSITIDEGSLGLTRDELQAALAAENIETRRYYHPPVHRQTAYRHYVTNRTSLENTDNLSTRILSLPIWSNMDPEIASRICSAIERAAKFAEPIRAACRQDMALSYA